MTNLLLIDCRESLKGFEHSIYADGKKTLTTYLPGVIVDTLALNEFIKRPFDFVKKYDLETIRQFILRKP